MHIKGVILGYDYSKNFTIKEQPDEQSYKVNKTLVILDCVMIDGIPYDKGLTFYVDTLDVMENPDGAVFCQIYRGNSIELDGTVDYDTSSIKRPRNICGIFKNRFTGEHMVGNLGGLQRENLGCIQCSNYNRQKGMFKHSCSKFVKRETL